MRSDPEQQHVDVLQDQPHFRVLVTSAHYDIDFRMFGSVGGDVAQTAQSCCELVRAATIRASTLEVEDLMGDSANLGIAYTVEETLDHKAEDTSRGVFVANLEKSTNMTT